MLDKLDLVVEIEELLEGCGNYPFGDDYHEYPCELIISPFVKNYQLFTIVEKLLDSGCYCWTKEFQPDLRYKIGGKLGNLLIDNLLEVKQYKIFGYDGLFIYTGGIAEDGDWIGLYTRQKYSY
jgi:hypothetical protein